MAHFEKYKSGNVVAVIKHDERTNTYYKEHIDKSLTKNNIIYDVNDNAVEFLKQRINAVKEHGGMVRDNSTLMVSCIVSLPKDFMYLGDREKEKKFFDSVVEFLHNDFGKENCVSAVVHYDEPGAAPHLHYKTTPVIEKVKHYKGTKRNNYKDKRTEKVLSLDAKHKISRDYLLGFHNRLQEHLEHCVCCPCNIVNGASFGVPTVRALKELTAVRALIEDEQEKMATLSCVASDFPDLMLLYNRILETIEMNENVHSDGYSIQTALEDFDNIISTLNDIAQDVDEMYFFEKNKQYERE